MAFNPNLPADHALIEAGELRAQLNALKALIDAGGGGGVPVGCVQAWAKSLANTPALAAGWAECNGQVLNDPASVYHGVALPDLNGALGGAPCFLRGGTASGATGGSETHFHAVDLNVNGGSAQAGADFVMVPPGNFNAAAASSLPTYYEAVWIIKVK